MANQQSQKRPASESPASTPPPSVRERDGYLNNEPSSSWSSFEAEQSEFRSPSRLLTSSPSPFSPFPDYPSLPSPSFSQADEDNSLNGSVEAALNTFTDSVNFAANTFAYTVKQLFLNGREQRQVNTASNGTTTSTAAVSTNGHHGSAAASAKEEWPSLNSDLGFGGGLLNGNSSTLGNKSTTAAAASAADKFGGGFQDRVNFCEKVIKSKKSKGGGSRGGNSSSSNSSASAGNANTASGGGSGQFALKDLL